MQKKAGVVSNKLKEVPKENFYKSGASDTSCIELSKINDSIWVHTSYENYNGSRTPSNDLVAVTSKAIILVDTPWNNEQTKELLRLTKEVFNKDIVLAPLTHAHEDRIGGIDPLLENKIDVRSTELTAKDAEKRGYKKPQPTLDKQPSITVGDTSLEVFYPGIGQSNVICYPVKRVSIEVNFPSLI
ncbi:MAG: MBL fold metallo-hydrolase [Bacillota bacterium]|nr:MBL fold metallo-hydrolase [Bacillota bacterium]